MVDACSPSIRFINEVTEYTYGRVFVDAELANRGIFKRQEVFVAAVDG